MTNVMPMMATGDTSYYSSVEQREQSQLSAVLEQSNLVKSESMDLANDPRFFTNNVIDKRLAAFAGLSIISTFMMNTSMEAAFQMRKEINLVTWDGVFQLAGFCLTCCVLFCNTLAAYVGVAQPYHTYRLMTSGPSGFETAAAYYLQRDIVAWRHLAIKLMVTSMPAFLIANAFRFVVKFDRDSSQSPRLPSEPPLYVRLEGLVCCVAFVVVGLGLLQVHWLHEEVFRTLYSTMHHGSGMSALMTRARQMMSPSVTGYAGGLDV
eukprot:CAMPEP_0171097620 /NCGR_PEP_ID=MMETSP0766_2-20121228/47654_1 /TAXON_ID=439317 /ORGANISM="Gambierdiscus australes, Strain CAWD 149" /LENGTH=263 /DNA_ID=CAMNT_0011556847 /DNA_START=64 /DNA_END=855 /DNA_ORIENTATION=-